MTELDKYRKQGNTPLSIRLSEKAIKFFADNPDLKKTLFARDAIDEKIDRESGE